MRTHNVRRGFTLTELLVVLTVIGMLAALLLPVLLKAREQAQQTVCESNLHQIGLAIQMYQADNAGRLPTQFGDVRAVAAAEQLKQDPLLPYEHAPAIYHCPDAPYHVDGSFGTFGAVYLDYNSRIQQLLTSNTGWFPSGVPDGLMKPEPMSVLVYDAHHVNNERMYLTLREDGSVSRVPEAQTQLWEYVNAKWQLLSPTSTNKSQPWTVFPSEPWPPNFEQ